MRLRKMRFMAIILPLVLVGASQGVWSCNVVQQSSKPDSCGMISPPCWICVNPDTGNIQGAYQNQADAEYFCPNRCSIASTSGARGAILLVVGLALCGVIFQMKWLTTRNKDLGPVER